ncbi:HAD superfamily hydrolase (TIGR01509 family)/HAD superfamily hydrolase (TIGR01549 family) [Tamaricihabitans halophyticus]|uniref:HAD superfamily hydrolase (TIGR01509 family)/HAD superfamily hydrolase (TIGR01549 family) n=1 Tax=Tamaricihabitans halophyticus TaxID=1262583 RepID=A0A4R2R5L1_9PSEU|nr:HAD family phosphatase [Tamaricihabitans halophyticus]TCP57284.1 HAD superfamily hydrolase (TIGR01509 family)/HAD superfamily hydrolase (TIGR01549 family) [Tamaricihabitans halophyticus]
MNGSTAQELLARTHALLLDFDGPVCSVFAGIPANTVAEQLRVVLADEGHAQLPAAVRATSDPFDVFRYAATLGQAEARYVEAAFTAHELEAITTAEPTPGAHDLIHSWHQSGRPLAIVSNNSTQAVRTYLDLHALAHQINYVSARTSSDVALLKPDPHLINQAVTALDVEPEACTLIGDSLTDIEAAHAARTAILGYANKPHKTGPMGDAGAQAVITTLG